MVQIELPAAHKHSPVTQGFPHCAAYVEYPSRPSTSSLDQLQLIEKATCQELCTSTLVQLRTQRTVCSIEQRVEQIDIEQKTAQRATAERLKARNLEAEPRKDNVRVRL